MVVVIKAARPEVSQSVSHYHTPSRELMDHTHTTVLLFRKSNKGDNLCIFVFLYFSLVFRQGPHFRMMFFSLRFSPLLLVGTQHVPHPLPNNNNPTNATCHVRVGHVEIP